MVATRIGASALLNFIPRRTFESVLSPSCPCLVLPAHESFESSSLPGLKRSSSTHLGSDARRNGDLLRSIQSIDPLSQPQLHVHVGMCHFMKNARYGGFSIWNWSEVDTLWPSPKWADRETDEGAAAGRQKLPLKRFDNLFYDLRQSKIAQRWLKSLSRM